MRSSTVVRSLLVAASTALVVAAAPPVSAGADPSSTSTSTTHGTVVPTGSPTATTVDGPCPHRVNTPPAIDDSEVVAPGKTAPAPLPVPSPAIGGERLGGCGVVADPAAGPVPRKLTSKGWLIADLDTGTVIAAQDPHGRYRPASTIKILLALVALDELDLKDRVVATVDDWSMEGDACGLGPGGRYTVDDMITGLLVVSGNDCANALSRELGGYQQTLDKMNAKAKELGALDTRAATPSGLDSAGMSTSPYDLAVLFRAGMQNDDFRRMTGLATYKFPGYPPRKDVPGDTAHPGYMMATSNTLLRDGVPGMTILGGKTGFTDDAKKTFVGAAEKDGRQVLIVQMFGLNEQDNSYHQQAVRMFKYGFAAPASVEVGTLNAEAEETTTAAPAEEEDRSADPRAADTGSDSLALGALPLTLIVVAALAVAATVLFRVRRRRRSAEDDE
ncbi:MAG: serine hydrolase [Gordonia sp. (in: high G+C Gram-positive bacteria)]|uniref:D-alanyl-D-alanine carboxypeptidase family protein n=1 Tax=Gordonia sp. (in: high G+C Gram-positive bacteria) TaxID=84139 RepID=UPI0039E71CFA